MTLEQVYALPKNIISSIIEKNLGQSYIEYTVSNFKLNRLIATIYIANNNDLDKVDTLYISNPEFKELYLSDDDYIINYAIEKDIHIKFTDTRFDIMRKLLQYPEEEPQIITSGYARLGGLVELVNVDGFSEALRLKRDINWQTVSYLGRQIKIHNYKNWLDKARLICPTINNIIYLGYSQSKSIFILGFNISSSEYIIWYKYNIDKYLNILHITPIEYSSIDFSNLIDLKFSSHKLIE